MDRSIKDEDDAPGIVLTRIKSAQSQTVAFKTRISLQQVVQEKNCEVAREMKTFEAIMRKQKERYKELQEVDCADMLSTANVQIKVLNQILDRLIPEDDQHSVLKEGKLYNIEACP